MNQAPAPLTAESWLNLLPPEVQKQIPTEWKKLPPQEAAQKFSDWIQYQEKSNKLANYEPYTKQKEFHRLGATNREVMFFAGNRLGKSLSASMEVAYHLTGLYPDWWEGRRFKKAPEFWVASEDYELLRDVAQRLLFGPPEEIGTGSIPRDRIKKVINRQGLSGAIDTALIKHVSGGTARCKFKSYKEGRAEFQGASVSGVWFDEEPKSEDALGIYMEALTRTNDQQGLMLVTFTPLKGSTTLVNRFVIGGFKNTAFLTMTIYDVGHYTAEQIEDIINQYPEHERAVRAFGAPKMGSGTVFASIDPKKVEYDADTFGEIPSHWYRICGQDYGLAHPTTLVWIAHDRDTNSFYVYDVHCASDALPSTHYAAWKERGEYIPVAWPKDGHQRSKDTGIQLAQQYRDLGMNMLHEHALLPQVEGERETGQSRASVEAGVKLMLTAMREGRFRIAKHLDAIWNELRMYHRNERGIIVDRNDDCISGMRYGFIMALQGYGEQKFSKRKYIFGRSFKSRYS
jgi:phage terminase large subunit-like protein